MTNLIIGMFIGAFIGVSIMALVRAGSDRK
jgi:hypothetical protein